MASFLGVKKPEDILTALDRYGFDQPKKTQLYNVLQYHKRKIGGCTEMNTHQFEEWCRSKSDIPGASEPDRAFVVAFETGVNEDGDATIKLFASTRRLLGLAKLNDRIHVDGTYKLNWNKFPVLVAGTTDQDGKFHPYGIGVSSSETTEDFTFLFKAIADGFERVHGQQYRPKILIADCADAITKGFGNVFDRNFQRIYCYFHVKKIRDKDTRQRILDDIDELQKCESEAVFDVAVRLFFEMCGLAECGN